MTAARAAASLAIDRNLLSCKNVHEIVLFSVNLMLKI